MSEYYVLGQEGEPVLIHLRDEPGYGKIVALAVYTAEDGGQQREDLQRYKDTSVLPMSAEHLWFSPPFRASGAASNRPSYTTHSIPRHAMPCLGL